MQNRQRFGGWLHLIPWLLICRLIGAQAQQAAALNSGGLKLPQALLTKYFSNEEMVIYMKDYAERCGNISRLFSIGKSSSGLRDLWVLEISNNPGVREAKPYIKFVANMHGNEPSGRQILLQFAEWVCGERSSDPLAARLVNEFHIMILPSMNPDGFDRRHRANSHGKDLNRDFPDPIAAAHGKGWSSVLPPTGREAAETAAVMKWSLEHRFVAGVSMHEGAVVANYPWDGSLDRKTHYSSCPDDEAYKHLATVYANSNPQMKASREFPGGITNGAGWYPLFGGMQDWNYLMADCFDLTLELSQHKWPPPEQLPELWESNKKSLVQFSLLAAFGGAWGTVRGIDRAGENGAADDAPARPLLAKISVSGISKQLKSSSLGDFYRPLAPGKYSVTAAAEGYQDSTETVTVPGDGSGAKIDFILRRDESRKPPRAPPQRPAPVSAHVPVQMSRNEDTAAERQGASISRIQDSAPVALHESSQDKRNDPKPPQEQSMLLSRAAWLYVALLVIMAAALCFGRPARRRSPNRLQISNV